MKYYLLHYYKNGVSAANINGYGGTGDTSIKVLDTGNQETKYYSASLGVFTDRGGNVMYLQGSDDGNSWTNIVGTSSAPTGGGGTCYCYFGSTNYRYFRYSVGTNRANFNMGTVFFCEE